MARHGSTRHRKAIKKLEIVSNPEQMVRTRVHLETDESKEDLWPVRWIASRRVSSFQSVLAVGTRGVLLVDINSSSNVKSRWPGAVHGQRLAHGLWGSAEGKQQYYAFASPLTSDFALNIPRGRMPRGRLPGCPLVDEEVRR